MGLTFDDRATALLDPARQVLESALTRLPESAPLHVAVGDWVSGFYELQGGTLVLSASLEGPALHHPDERAQGIEPLDRWRRAVGSVIEGLVLHILEGRHGAPVPRDWRAVGLAIDQADRVGPELRLAVPDLAAAVQLGQPGLDPRQGVAAMRAWRAQGVDPVQRVLDALRDSPVSPAEWLELGQWVLGGSCAASLPLPVQRRAGLDIPAQLGPWEWARLEVPAHARGGHVLCEGEVSVERAWAVAGRPLECAAASTAGGRLAPDVGGPVGEWELLTAQAYGQVFGSRGVTYGFRGDGSVQIVLADAFLGPLAALEVSKQVGSSGVVTGRWTVQGPKTMGFHGISGQQVTVHGRDEAPFVMPTGGMGLAAAMQALEQSSWRWSVDGDALELAGKLGGGPVVIRLRRV